VIACHILFNDFKCAIIEFNDKQTVKKILDTSNIRLQGVNLSLSKASRHLASLLFSTDNQDESDDEVQTLHSKPILSSLTLQNQSLSSTRQENIQQQLLSFMNLTPSPVIIEPIFIPSSE
jgi:hypothetical protein